MLKEIILENYRGFDEHIIPFRNETIIVGKNNAGKSTIIEAVSLISAVVMKVPWLKFLRAPSWLDVPNIYRGFSPSLRWMEFEYRNLCHRYSDPPAVITGRFHDNKKISIYLNSDDEDIFAVLFDEHGDVVLDRQAAKEFLAHKIYVLPPIGRLRINEALLANADYVKAHLHSTLTPLHFRNQLYFFGTEKAEDDEESGFGDAQTSTRLDVFSRLAEATWPHLKIGDLDATGNPKELSLLVRDGPFVAEVGWVGQGLQAWLQTCWFLARCPRSATIVLDEPDVYLHADLQRKLLRLVKDHFEQVVIATHSIEILSEVSAESVLIVDRDRKESKFAEKVPAVQSVINNIGGAHNIQFARLWSAKKCIFIEGDDLEFLNAFHKINFPLSDTSFGSLPGISIGGYGNWRHAIGAAIGLKNAGGEAIVTYCILDSDYKSEEDHNKVRKEAGKHGINLHIWKRKEIENYVLNPKTLARYINSKTNKKKVDENIIVQIISDICDHIKDEIFDIISNEIGVTERNGSASANKKARVVINSHWSTFEGKIAICPGKQVVSSLSKWAQEKYGVSFSALSVAREMVADEIDNEMRQVVSAIEESRAFSP